MILTCPQCQSQYTLDPAQLGAGGRDVRCVACSHIWFQGVAPPPAAEKAETQKSAVDAIASILEKDDAALDAVLAGMARAEGKKPPPETPSEPPPSFAAAMAAEEEKAPAAPPPREEKRAMVRQETALPVITHNPFGMGAGTFGAAVFLLFAFLTLAPLFAARDAIVRHWPSMALFYRTAGFSIMAPGEGLRFSEVTAEKRVDGRSRALVVTGRLTNTTKQTLDYPELRVVMKDEKGAVTKEWSLKPGMATIASGDVMPLTLQLEDLPEEGTTVELRVKEKK